MGFIKKIDARDAPHEIEIHRIAESYGFAPKILNVREGNRKWFVEMEHFGDCSDLACMYGDKEEDIPEEIWEQIRDMVQTLFTEEGIEYLDVTPYNFVENKEGKLYMIDYGDARYYDESVGRDWFLQEFLDDEVNMWNPDFR